MEKKLLLFFLQRSTNKGLSLLEVLVATMVVFLTLMGALQGVLYAAIFQVKAERQALASYWIQQDLENIQSIAASSVPSDNNKCTSAFTTSYAGASTNSLQALTQAVIAGNYVSNSKSGTTVTTIGTRSLFNKPYTMTRITSGSDTNPQVLTISYTVNNANDVSNLATLYTEIIPSAALSCP